MFIPCSNWFRIFGLNSCNCRDIKGSSKGEARETLVVEKVKIDLLVLPVLFEQYFPQNYNRVSITGNMDLQEAIRAIAA